MRTRGDLLSFAIAFALRGARKLVRGFREELTEEERYRVADDVVHQLKQHGDPATVGGIATARKGTLDTVSREKKPRQPGWSIAGASCLSRPADRSGPT